MRRKFKVKCRKCGTIFNVESKFEPKRCMWCGHDDIWKNEYGRVDREWLVEQSYEAPEDAPRLSEMDDPWKMRELTGVGYTLCRRVVIATQEQGMVFEKPTDLLRLGGIGVATAARFIGKVRFG